MGHYVSPDIYIDLVIPQLKTGGGGVLQFRIGALKVLSNLVKGSAGSDILSIDHITRIMELVASEDVISNESIPLMREISCVVNSVLLVRKGTFDEKKDPSYLIFYILTFLKSCDGDLNVVGYTELIQSVSFP